MEPFSSSSITPAVESPSPYTGWRYCVSAGLGWIFVIGGLLAALFALWLGWQTRQFVAHGTRGLAKIVDFIYYPPDRHTGGLYRPVFAFADASGKSWQVTAQSSHNPPAYKKGDEVTILYSAEDPAGARLNTTEEVWGNTIIVGIGGAFMMLMGLLIVVWMSVMKNRTTSTDSRWWDRWFVPIKALLYLFR